MSTANEMKRAYQRKMRSEYSREKKRCQERGLFFFEGCPITGFVTMNARKNGAKHYVTDFGGRENQPEAAIAQ